MVHRQAFPKFEVVTSNLGNEGEGYIDAVKRSSGGFVAFTNADCYVPTNWLQALFHRIEQGYDIVGSPRAPAVGPPGLNGFGFGWSSCMVRRSVLGAVPLRGLAVHQDYDFLIRARESGFRISLVRELVVYHDHKNTMRRTAMAAANSMAILRRNGSRPPTRQALLMFLPPSSLGEFKMRIAVIAGTLMGRTSNDIVDIH